MLIRDREIFSSMHLTHNPMKFSRKLGISLHFLTKSHHISVLKVANLEMKSIRKIVRDLVCIETMISTIHTLLSQVAGDILSKKQMQLYSLLSWLYLSLDSI